MDLRTTYLIGWKLQYIKRAPRLGASVKGDNYIIDNLRWILDDLKEYNLSPITQHEIERIMKRFEESYGENEPLNTEDGGMITEKIKLWHDRISNELTERMTVEVFTDGTLNFKKLLGPVFTRAQYSLPDYS